MLNAFAAFDTTTSMATQRECIHAWHSDRFNHSLRHSLICSYIAAESCKQINEFFCQGMHGNLFFFKRDNVYFFVIIKAKFNAKLIMKNMAQNYEWQVIL